MGDFSRDSFQLTNVLHQEVLGGVVAEPRHYVDVRLQQGVPLLDADVNELQDIRRREMEIVLRDLIGDGVPGLGAGFAIAPIEVDNDFAIQPGVLIVGGWQVINPSLRNYSTLPRFLDAGGVSTGTDLTTPAADRTDLVYLDVWEREINGTDVDGDDRLIDVRVGIDTSVRTERAWTVRVAENETDFGALVLNEPGHKYYPLARLFRIAGNARIQDFMIEDLRRMGLTLADSLKAPMFAQRGPETVDPARFSQMLAQLRDVLGLWQENELFPINIGTFGVWTRYLNTLNHIYYLTTSAEVNSDTGNLDNTDGRTVLQKLVDAQRNLVTVVRDNGTGVPAEMAVMDLYETHLDGDVAVNIDGIQPALDRADLLGAVLGQEALTTFLGLSTGTLPEGIVTVTLAQVSPATPLATSVPFTITYDVQSGLLVPTTPEVFDVEAVVSDVRWAAALNLTELTLAQGATGQVEMTVTPGATLNPGDFADINLVARARRRPTLASVQPAQRFTIGQPPPGQTFFFYSGVTPLVGGVLNIQRVDIETVIYEVHFTLVNTTGGAQAHMFQLDYELVWPGVLPAGVDPNNWIPNAPTVLANQDVPGANTTAIINLLAPSLAGVTDPINVTLQITATHTHINGTPIGGGKTSTLDLPLVVAV